MAQDKMPSSYGNNNNFYARTFSLLCRTTFNKRQGTFSCVCAA